MQKIEMEEKQAFNKKKIKKRTKNKKVEEDSRGK